MKDSGIEWVGEIPTHWDIQTLKYQTEKYERGTAPDYTNEIMTKVVNQATFSKGYFDTRNIRYSSKDAKTSRGLLKKGDVLLASTGGGVLGKTHFFNEDDVYVADSHVTIVRTIDTLLSKYLYYYFSVNYSTFNAVMAEGSTNQTELQRDLLGKMPVPFPPIEEQQKIASFLDDKCTEIDSLISELKKQTETLADYKKSLITETVTKGLNKNVEMKDSGIEWIGEIPEHWQVKKVKYIGGSARNGLTYTPQDLCDDGILVLRSSNIQNGKIYLHNNVYVSCKIKPELMVQKGDILICSRNGSKELIGKNAIITDNIKAAFGAFMMIFRCNCAKYMYYILNSDIFSYYLGTFSTSTINQLTGANFNNMKIIYCPDIQEQNEIVSYLDEKCTEIDKIISEKKQQIKTIEEYKKSLIFEYVTGKKEVN